MRNDLNNNESNTRESQNNSGMQSRVSNRGFAAMDREKQRQIASQGGRAAHQQGTAHQWSSEEARAAGRKGGQARGNRNRNQSDRDNGQ